MLLAEETGREDRGTLPLGLCVEAANRILAKEGVATVRATPALCSLC